MGVSCSEQLEILLMINSVDCLHQYRNLCHVRIYNFIDCQISFFVDFCHHFYFFIFITPIPSCVSLFMLSQRISCLLHFMILYVPPLSSTFSFHFSSLSLSLSLSLCLSLSLTLTLSVSLSLPLSLSVSVLVSVSVS